LIASQIGRCIPLSAVSRLNENEVWLDVSKHEINARGWNEPIHS
jgi:hypothetical protein